MNEQDALNMLNEQINRVNSFAGFEKYVDDRKVAVTLLMADMMMAVADALPNLGVISRNTVYTCIIKLKDCKSVPYIQQYSSGQMDFFSEFSHIHRLACDQLKTHVALKAYVKISVVSSYVVKNESNLKVCIMMR